MIAAARTRNDPTTFACGILTASASQKYRCDLAKRNTYSCATVGLSRTLSHARSLDPGDLCANDPAVGLQCESDVLRDHEEVFRWDIGFARNRIRRCASVLAASECAFVLRVARAAGSKRIPRLSHHVPSSRRTRQTSRLTLRILRYIPREFSRHRSHDRRRHIRANQSMVAKSRHNERMHQGVQFDARRLG